MPVTTEAVTSSSHACPSIFLAKCLECSRPSASRYRARHFPSGRFWIDATAPPLAVDRGIVRPLLVLRREGVVRVPLVRDRGFISSGGQVRDVPLEDGPRGAGRRRRHLVQQ